MSALEKEIMKRVKEKLRMMKGKGLLEYDSGAVLGSGKRRSKKASKKGSAMLAGRKRGSKRGSKHLMGSALEYEDGAVLGSSLHYDYEDDGVVLGSAMLAGRRRSSKKHSKKAGSFFSSLTRGTTPYDHKRGNALLAGKRLSKKGSKKGSRGGYNFFDRPSERRRIAPPKDTYKAAGSKKRHSKKGKMNPAFAKYQVILKELKRKHPNEDFRKLQKHASKMLHGGRLYRSAR
jgi:hypothetical protein